MVFITISPQPMHYWRCNLFIWQYPLSTTHWHILRDLKKACDTVCHQTLLTKLDHYGMRGPAHKLLSSFIERKEYVSLNHVNSELQYNNYGVPRGSILGPLLFLLVGVQVYVATTTKEFLNNACLKQSQVRMPQAVASTTRLFADDTYLLLHASNPTSFLATLNLEISLFLEWCNSNKLTINPQNVTFL